MISYKCSHKINFSFMFFIIINTQSISSYHNTQLLLEPNGIGNLNIKSKSSWGGS